jgi:DNA-binding LytR/AlgR family response regulator
MPIRALIVDDEYPARMELRFRLGQYPDMEVIGEAASGREALALIEALDYDVVFLDVQMPGMTGVDLARKLREREKPPKLVFVTAYEHYALPAFEIRAVDYLLKPFDDARLAETVARLRELVHQPGPDPAPGSPPAQAAPPAVAEGEQPGEKRSGVQWVICEKEGRQIPVPVAEIVYLYSEGYNVYVVTQHERLVTRGTLQELTERLPPEMFFRSHRSYLVNIFQVREISPYFNGAYLMRMKDKEHSEVIVSRGNVKRLKELFSMG